MGVVYGREVLPHRWFSGVSSYREERTRGYQDPLPARNQKSREIFFQKNSIAIPPLKKTQEKPGIFSGSCRKFFFEKPDEIFFQSISQKFFPEIIALTPPCRRVSPPLPATVVRSALRR